MDFVKRHLFFFVCALVAAAGLVLGVTGLKAMPKVKQEMESAESIFRNLDSLRSNPVNRRHIDMVKRRIDTIKKDHEDVLERAKALYGWDLLIPGILPVGKPQDRLQFRSRYGDAMRTLLARLTWGKPATQDIINSMRDRITNEQAARASLRSDPNAAVVVPPSIDGPKRTEAGVLTAAGILLDPVARAHVAAAQTIYCYATDITDEDPMRLTYSTLEFDQAMRNTETVDPPFPDEVWNAQIGYWIQNDVVDAITAINNEAAEEITRRGDRPWVGVLPIKDVISIRLGFGLVPSDGDEVFGYDAGGYEPAVPPGTPLTVFTQRSSGDAFDVVQFTVKLVMDQRDITRFVVALTNDSFHTLLRVSYKAVPENRDLTGKIYGSDPSVNIVMDFETVLLGEVFRRLMPEEVLERGGVICRPQDECTPSS